MTKPRSLRSALLASYVVAPCLLVGCFAHAQTYYPNTEVRIHDLPALTAKSKDASDVLAASVEIAFRDKDVCCGKDSALEDDVQRADPKSLKEVANKLQGRHLLSDGRPIMVTAEFVLAPAVNSGYLIGAITEKRAPLMQWNSHLYVVCGVVYSTAYSTEGARMDSIVKIFLMDLRFSDERREVTFNRATDDWGKVQGLLMLRAAPL